MNVLFIQPHWFERKGKKDVKSLHSVSPPLGMLYLAACIKKRGHDAVLIDALAENLSVDEVLARAVKIKPDAVALTATTPQINFAFDAINAIKKELKMPVIVGGPHATAAPLETMKRCPNIDVVVYGEGELTFTELIDALEHNKKLDKVKGIYFKKNKKIVFTGIRPFITNLDILPFPARELLKSMSLYRLAPSDFKREPCTTMVTSRGCPFCCKYCNKAVFGNRYRHNSPEYVLKEIEYLMNKYKIREIKFWDDVFTLDRKRTERICDEMIKRKLKLVWSCETRVDLVEPALLKKMKAAGCWQIDYGIESGNQQIVDNIDKGIKLEKARQAIRWTHEAGISTRGYFILGLPGETVATANETIDFSIKCGLDFVTFFICVPYPGTRLYDMVKKEGCIVSDDWRKYSHIDFEHMIYVPKTIREEQLRHLISKAYKKFYFRPSYIIKQMMKIRSIKDVKEKIRGANALLGGFLK